jgi:23S rRNA pseudouridine2605 synthase
MRLAKFLASAGVASRRAAEQLIAQGRVQVDGRPELDPARDVGPHSAVSFDGQPVQAASELVVYALHKPAGVVSTARDPQRRPTVVSLIESDLRLYPVGRLDIDVTGLILLTNDGELAHRLTHPSFEVPKTYRARVRNPPVREATLARLRRGVELDDGPTAPAQARRLSPDTVQITIHEGRKRQVKRMFEQVGHRVAALQRVGFGPLSLGALEPGAYRRLGSAEVRALTTTAGSAARPSGTSSYARRRRPSPESPASASRPPSAGS